MSDYLTVFDFLLAPIYFVITIVIAKQIERKEKDFKPEYQFYTVGMGIKILGAITLGLVYIFHYGGGDTINYFTTAKAYVNLAFYDWGNFLEGWLGNPLSINVSGFFNEETGYPTYFHRDTHAFFVVRLLIPIVFIASGSYFCSAILTAVITFSGVWKLYRVFINEFPELKKELAYATILIPSCVFWGSGILKDSFTLSAVGWYTYGFYRFFILKQVRFSYLTQLLVSSIIILAIKPYIFFALMPGSVLWLTNNQIAKIPNQFLRVVAAPFLLSIGIFIGVFSLYKMGENLGLYRVETVLERASIVQKDMKAAYYNGNSFDIGDFDPSIEGVVGHAPQAIFAGFFRPGIWDVRNAVMLISALENTFLLVLTFFLFLKLKFIGFFIYVRKNPLVLFSMLFALFFSFSVGLTVSNFGSLVRLRIPSLPFFLASLIIIRNLYITNKKSAL